MAGLFISHSSKDKPFVQRLAIDLVARGMPIWFDTWEIDTGDSLRAKIYEGIGASDYVIVVLSPNSVASKWVDRELTAALSLEERNNRTYILPIRIAECETPLSLGDRIYADFSTSYLEALERLTARLRHLGVDALHEPTEHALIPLVFEKGIYLDSVQLANRIKSLRPRLPEGFEFTADQFVVAPDERYRDLRQRLMYRKEHLEDDAYYSPDFSRSFSELYSHFFVLEERLLEGIRLIVNGHVASKTSAYDVGWASHWFARNIRSQILHLLWSAQNPDDPKRTEYGKDCMPLPFMTNYSAAEFLEVEHVCYVDVGPADPSHSGPLARIAESVMIALDEDSSEVQFIKEAIVCAILVAGGPGMFSKYVVPQMVSQHLLPAGAPLTFDFDGWYVGLH